MKALDGVRGLAAVAVVAHHCLSSPVSPRAVSASVHTLQAIASYLYLGVDLFFVLSGYLITTLLLLARRRPDYYSNFYWKRVFRIIPALVLVLSLTKSAFSIPWSGICTALLFVANLSFVWGVPEIGPYWSLSIEEQFYLLWPTVIHRAKSRVILRVLIALIVISPILRAVSAALHHGNDRYTPLHCDGLAWGALLALMTYYARIPFSQRNSKALWLKAGVWMLGIGVVTMITALVLLRSGHIDYGLLLTATGPLFAGILLYLITHPGRGVARALGSKPLRFLGDISYMLYLSHSYILALYDNYYGHGDLYTGAGLLLRFGIVLAVSVSWSTVSLFFFERPIGRLRRYVLA